MHYVYLENNIVVDQAQIDPYKVFYPDYASKFIEVPDEVTFGWKLEDGVWISPPPPDYTSFNKLEASRLLQETDWTAIPTIADSQYSNPYLINQSDFLNYRNQLRVIAINPPSELITNWPTKPDVIWSN